MMDSLNPMFQKKKATRPKPVRTTNVRKKPITKNEGRKVRRDKKHDIKIPLTLDQRKMIKALARQAGEYPTNYLSQKMKTELPRAEFFPEPTVPYPSKSKLSYPVKLEQDYFKQLQDLSIEWDCSLRRAAYRIISAILS
ncbi:hypothetical protein ABFG93_22190 (plasmid) [Pseudalkalibacillus hwajinpoensis]|uniref:hypothetical protein n=1 Tax=Guptibacillus hwajinpoensis TaxID=208199 RepID=UPI00325C1EE2